MITAHLVALHGVADRDDASAGPEMARLLRELSDELGVALLDDDARPTEAAMLLSSRAGRALRELADLFDAADRLRTRSATPAVVDLGTAGLRRTGSGGRPRLRGRSGPRR